MTIAVNAVSLDVDAGSPSIATVTVRATESTTGQQIGRDVLVQIALNGTQTTAVQAIMTRAVNKLAFRFTNAATVRQSDPTAQIDITQAVSGEPA